MSTKHSSLRVRPLVSAVLFVSGYSPLLVILVIKDMTASNGLSLGHPLTSAILLAVALLSSIAVITATDQIKDGLSVEVTRAVNKSGDMFGYSIPYVLSFLKINLDDWQVIASLGIYLLMLFVIAYRTQTYFVNPILALRGYMLVDCSFKRDNVETQALVLTREPVQAGNRVVVEQLSRYLYVANKSAQV